jgi:hypothetical protein
MLINGNMHRAFLVKEMQVQSDQANRIEKQIIKVLNDNGISSIEFDTDKEIWFVTPNGTKYIGEVIVRKHNGIHRLYLMIDNEFVTLDDYEYGCNIDWVELMYRVLDGLEPNIMD